MFQRLLNGSPDITEVAFENTPELGVILFNAFYLIGVLNTLTLHMSQRHVKYLSLTS